MKGLLFYDEAGAKRNKWFIERLIESARECGCELSLVITDEVSDALSECDPSIDLAIVRAIFRQFLLCFSLECRYILTFRAIPIWQ